MRDLAIGRRALAQTAGAPAVGADLKLRDPILEQAHVQHPAGVEADARVGLHPVVGAQEEVLGCVAQPPEVGLGMLDPPGQRQQRVPVRHGRTLLEANPKACPGPDVGIAVRPRVHP